MNNLIVRTISGIAFIIITIAAILWSPISYALLFAFIIGVMINEYINIVGGRALILHKILAIASGVMLFTSSLFVIYLELSPLFLATSLAPLMAIFIVNLYNKGFNKHNIQENGERESNGYEVFPYAITSVIYIALPFALTNLVLFNSSADSSFSSGKIYTPEILLVLLILLWANDVGAYCVGSTLGRKFSSKLFASISPKKSWVGFWGGLFSSIIIGYAISLIPFFNITGKNSVILAIIICIFGVWGDLAESQLKRNYGVKDSGKIMPGHGGMLDRFDAALIAFPAAVFAILTFM